LITFRKLMENCNKENAEFKNIQKSTYEWEMRWHKSQQGSHSNKLYQLLNSISMANQMKINISRVNWSLICN
jgi:hypothetical protein